MNFNTIIIFAVLIVTATVTNALNPCHNQENGKMFPYNNNPYNYLLCQDNDSLLMICDDGELFNIEKGECNKKHYLDTNVTINESENRDKLKRYCEHLSNGIKLPYSKNCEEYYVCYDKVAHLRRCESSLYFSSRKAACVRREEAECDISFNDGKCENQADGTMLPHQTDCDKFYVCAHDESVEKICPFGLHFSPKISVCTYPEDAGCEHSDFCKDKINGKAVANPRNCSKYYLCFHDEARPKDCADGLHFSPTEEYCMLPELAGCETNLTTTANPNTSTTTTTTNPTTITTTTSTTTSPPPTYKCKNETIPIKEPHPNNCSKFYLCWYGDPIEKECPFGQHFSATKVICTNPEDAGCEGLQSCKNTVNGEQVPNPRNCSSFYLCFNDDAKLKECPNDLHFSPKERVCMLPELAGCDPNHNSTTTTTRKPPTPPTPPTPTTPPTDICKGEIDGEVFPYPYDCGKFYVCSNNEAKIKSCAPDLHFSPEMKYCMNPEKAGCVEISTTTDGAENTTTETSPSPGDICKNEKDGEFFPYPDDCEKFYVCTENKANLKSCSPGLHFSPTSKYCRPPHLAGCDPPFPNEICKNQTDGTMFPYPDDCEKFWVCSDNVAKLKTCGPNLHFSPTKLYCTLPELAGCETNSTTTENPITTTSSQPGDMCKDEKDGKVFPYPEDCEKFYICWENKANLKSCSPGLHFSPTAKYCMPPHLAGCDPNHSTTTTDGTPTVTPTDDPITPTEDPITTTSSQPGDMCKDEKDGKVFPYPEDCEKFYICWENKANLKSCSPGLHFSPTAKYCMPPHLAGCDPNHNATTTDNTPTVTDEPPTTSPVTPTDDPITTTENPHPGSCKGQPLGINVKHPKDCTKYIVCIGGGVVMNCPPPLEFSENLKVCDWPERANCTVAATKKKKPLILLNKPIRKTPPTKIKPLKTKEESCKGVELGKNVKHPSDCTKYIVCIDEGVERNCPTPLEFNETLEVCDWPERANCKA